MLFYIVIYQKFGASNLIQYLSSSLLSGRKCEKLAKLDFVPT